MYAYLSTAVMLNYVHMDSSLSVRCVYTHTHIYIYMYVYMYMCMYIYIYIHMCLYTHAYHILLCRCICCRSSDTYAIFFEAPAMRWKPSKQDNCAMQAPEEKWCLMLAGIVSGCQRV